MKRMFLALHLISALVLVTPVCLAKDSSFRGAAPQSTFLSVANNGSAAIDKHGTAGSAAAPTGKASSISRENQSRPPGKAVDLQLEQEGNYNAHLERERSLKRAREAQSSQFREIEGQMQRQQETRTREIRRAIDRAGQTSSD